MEPFAPPPGLDFNKIFVPTIDTTRYSYLVKQFLSMSQPVLFIGESGTAKSVTMQNTLESFPADLSVILNINYSSRTSSLDFQRTMEDSACGQSGQVTMSLHQAVLDNLPPTPTKCCSKQLKRRWEELCGSLGVSKGIEQKWWDVLETRYTEKQRAYHTLSHLAEMFGYFEDPVFATEIFRKGREKQALDNAANEVLVLREKFHRYLGLDLTNVEVVIVYSYIWKHAHQHNVKTMYRGIRSFQKDGAAEKFLEAQNVIGQVLLGGRRPIPTVYIQADPRFVDVSSTMLRQRINMGESISDLVPDGYLSRVFQGICQADPQVVNNASVLIRLWRNECTRVYEDRFNEDADKESHDTDNMGHIRRVSQGHRES
eukprot:g25502.t1